MFPNVSRTFVVECRGGGSGTDRVERQTTISARAEAPVPEVAPEAEALRLYALLEPEFEDDGFPLSVFEVDEAYGLAHYRPSGVFIKPQHGSVDTLGG